VKINNIHPQNRCRWLEKPFLSYPYLSWLLETGSLTARLQKRYRGFSVKPLIVKIAKASRDDAGLLGLAANSMVIRREVFLFGDNQPVVFAQSILPRKSLHGDWRNLGKLGNRPLGATLFANPKVRRTPLTYKKLSANHALYQSATRYLTEKPAFLWARRSVFSLACASIIVTEVFLPCLITPDESKETLLIAV